MLKQLIFKAFVFLLGIFSIIFGGRLMANQPSHDKCPSEHYVAPATASIWATRAKANIHVQHAYANDDLKQNQR